MCCTSAMLGCKGLMHEPLSFIFADMFPVCLFFVMVSRRRRTHMPGDSAIASHWCFRALVLVLCCKNNVRRQAK